MTIEQFLLTVVPRPGVGAGQPGQPYSAAVCIAVRLHPDTEGAALDARTFPVFGNWAQYAGTAITIAVNGGAPVRARTVTSFDQTAWNGLLAGLPVYGVDGLQAAQAAAAQVALADVHLVAPVWTELNSINPWALTPAPPADVPAARAAIAAPRTVGSARPAASLSPLVPVARPTLDVHARIAHLQDFPQTLRLLGLIQDVEFTWPEAVAGRTFTLSAQMALPPSALVTSVTTSIGSAVDASSMFEPAADLTIVPIDTDHAARQLIGWVGGDTAPALRSPGPALVRLSGQKAHLTNRLTNRVTVEQQVKTGGQPSITTDDLLAGYRVDVADTDDGVWHSLCARTYTVAQRRGGVSTPLLPPMTDEGVVSSSVATSTSGASWISDALTRWTGWSLVVPKPGTPLQTNVGPAPADTGITMPASVPDGTLPQLRYGHHYAMRMRRVLLDGSSAPADAPSDPATTESYARAEAVQAPTVLPAYAPLGPGASVGRLVIRRRGDTSDGPDRRWLMPPAVSVDMAERHGMFDGPGGRLDPSAWSTIQAHEGSLWSAAPPTAPESAKADLISAATWTTAPPMRYLPDPMAQSVVLTVTTGGAALGVADGSTLTADFTGATQLALPGAPTGWPNDVGPIALELAAASGPTGGWSYDQPSRTITVALPPAARATIAVACGLPTDRLAQMGAVAWASTPPTTVWTSKAVMGQLPGLSATRTIDLVHAVDQPLIAPAFDPTPSIASVLGDTGATLSGAIAIDASSTHQVDVYAIINDYVDAGPGTPAPLSSNRTVHLSTLTVVPGQPVSLDGVRVETGDLAAHVVTLTATASTAFRDFYLPLTPLPPRSGLPWIGTVPARAQPRAPHIHSVVPTYGWTRSSDGTSASSAADGNGFRVYLRRPAGGSGGGERLVVRASASVIGNDPLVLGAAAPTALADDSWRGGRYEAALEAYSYPLDFDPDFPGDVGRYSADVCFVMPTGAAYRPFIDLSIAIMQPSGANSQPSTAAGPALVSPWVNTGLYQVAPSLSIAVTVSEPYVTVSTSGLDAQAARDANQNMVGFYNTSYLYCVDAGLYTEDVDPDGDTVVVDSSTGPGSGLSFIGGGKLYADQPQTVTSLTFRAGIVEMYGNTELRQVLQDEITIELAQPIKLIPKPTGGPKKNPNGKDGSGQTIVPS